MKNNLNNEHRSKEKPEAEDPLSKVEAVDYLADGHPSVPKERIEVIGAGSSYVLDDFHALRWITPAGTGELAPGGQDKEGARAGLVRRPRLLHARDARRSGQHPERRGGGIGGLGPEGQERGVWMTPAQ